MKRKIFILILLVIINFILANNEVLSDDYGADGDNSFSNEVTLDNPLGTTKDVNTLIGQIINGVLGVVGSLALLMFVYGGIVWMTAAGSPEKVQKGKNILIWATIGIVVIFTAYAMVKFVLGILAGGVG